MIVVVGAGPAGIAAALAANECGRAVTVIDENPAAGGQIWRGDSGQRWVVRFRNSGIPLMAGARVVWGDPVSRTLLLEFADGARQIQFETLVIATGSRERFLPFPGWTLPGVFGAGGLQALAKSGLPVRGKDIVVAGTGPLLLAVAAYLRGKGANIRLIAEQTPAASLWPFAWNLAKRPAKSLQGLRLAWDLAGVPYVPASWVVSANGDGRIQSVVLNRRGSIVTEECDYLAVGFGLQASTELATLLAGPDTLVAATGDADLALLEGRAAGYRAAGNVQKAAAMDPELRRARAFADDLDKTFALRDELRHLAGADTIVCRCEDVPLGRLEGRDSFRDAKLHTRCGMGPCQGRICGPALNFLFGWPDTSQRPPILPARIGTLLAEDQGLRE